MKLKRRKTEEWRLSFDNSPKISNRFIKRVVLVGMIVFGGILPISYKSYTQKHSSYKDERIEIMADNKDNKINENGKSCSSSNLINILFEKELIDERKQIDKNGVNNICVTDEIENLELLPKASILNVEEGKEHNYERVKFNNPGLIVDLGVGLWAYPLPIDYDGDGDLDLLVNSPSILYNGLWFFENPGNSDFPIFKAPIKVAEGMDNVQISYVNNSVRVLIPGIEFLNFTDSLFNQPTILYSNLVFDQKLTKIRANGWKYVDYDGDGNLDIIIGIGDWTDYGWDNAFDMEGRWINGQLHGYIYLLKNEGTGKYSKPFKLQAAGRDIDVYGQPSPNFADFDNDGDLDIICGEFFDKLTWFENIGTRSAPKYASGKYITNGKRDITIDTQMIVAVAVDWNADGNIDLITGDEDGRVAFVENTGKINVSGPCFKMPRYFQQQADDLKFGSLVTPFSVDWDEDGDEDLICGTSAGYIGFIENLDGGNPPKWDKPKLLRADGKVIRIMAGYNGSIQGPAEKKWGYTTLSVADWDGDGLKDIIFNSIFGKVEWYKNIGTKNSPVLNKVKPVFVEWKEDVPKPEWNWWEPKNNQLVTQWRTTPFAIDWNRDGLIDLIMLDYEGYLAYFERYFEGGMLKLKPGQRIFYGIDNSIFGINHEVINSSDGLLRLNADKYGKSGRRKICFSDWDNDGDFDILVNSENVSLLENTGSIKGIVLLKNKGGLSNVKMTGHTTSPTVVDWDKNGIPDLLIGGEDGHFYFCKNTRILK
ncbi:MAG: VCBS repeat-containing protein [Candidatus Micrarchaeia archaeon]|jgi:hypothetical protein